MKTLTKIEREIVENQKRMNEIEYEVRENYNDESWILEHEYTELEKHNKVLELERRHKLDRRNSWRAKMIWSILVPIILSLLISMLSVYFGLK